MSNMPSESPSTLSTGPNGSNNIGQPPPSTPSSPLSTPIPPPPPAQSTEAAKDILFGSLAGAIGKVIEYPFDTIKVRLQSQPHPPIYTGPLDCFQKSLKNTGIHGLYRGISAPLVGAAIETSSLFFSYRIAQDVLLSTLYKNSPQAPMEAGGKLPFSALVVAGGISGAFTSLLLTPIELVKCQMQVPASPSQTGRGPLKIIGEVFKHHGIFGLWHGQLGTLIRETGGSAAWFGSYEGVSALCRGMNARASGLKDASPAPLHVYQQLLGGAAAGVAYNSICFPADTIKSRMQTGEVTGGLGEARLSFVGTGRQIWREGGARGLYRGCGITCARAAPSSAVVFTIFGKLKE